ncbi:MAG: hypothetical protein IKT46_04500 [Clostridia bacterium]|nr:hypothetical protein [Clostridia bacterium]
MRTPEERRAEVHLLASRKIRERKKRVRTSIYCSVSITLVCTMLFLIPSIANNDNVNTHTDNTKIGSSGGKNSYIKSIEFDVNGKIKEYKDRPTVTLINLCIMDILKGEYTEDTDIMPICSLTYNYSNGNKVVYKLTEDSLIVNNKCYSISYEQYNKLMGYLE